MNVNDTDFHAEIEKASDFFFTVNGLFQYIYLFEGLPQFLLNSLVIVSIAAILRKNGGDSTENPAFVFIGNLAVADLVFFAAEIVAVKMKSLNYSPEATSQSRRYNCRLEISMVTFCLSGILFSSVLITIDRYIYITLGMRYSAIMTRPVIVVSIVAVWTCTTLVSLSTFFLERTDELGTIESNCVYSHLVPKDFAALSVVLILLVLLAIYVLYGIILVKFYQQKKQLEIAKKSRSTIRFRPSQELGREISVEDSSFVVSAATLKPAESGNPRSQTSRRRQRSLIPDGGRSVYFAMVRIARFVAAAQYVIVLIVAFTAAWKVIHDSWMPWIVIIIADIAGDTDSSEISGCFRENSTGLAEAEFIMQNLLRKGDPVLARLHLEDAIGGCGQDAKEAFVRRAVHSLWQDNLQLISFMVGALNSILDPVVYAFFYPQFREQVKTVLSLVGFKSRRPNNIRKFCRPMAHVV